MFAVPALVHLRLNTWALWRGQRGQWERHQSLGREEARDWHWPGPGTCSGAVLAKPEGPSPGNILVSEATVHGLQVRSRRSSPCQGSPVPLAKGKNLLRGGVLAVFLRLLQTCVKVTRFRQVWGSSRQLARSDPQSVGFPRDEHLCSQG